MTKTTKQLLFVLFFIVIIWPLSFLIFKAKSPEAREIANIISTKSFLSTLQNKSAEACIAMTYMDRVDVVIVGSSLAYSNIDPLVFSEQFGGQSVAVCALSGWNTDYFELFFKFIKENNIAPKRVVWLADYSSHLKVNLHEKRLEYASNVLFSDEFRNKTAQRWIDTLGTKEQSEEQLNTYNNRIAFHSNHLSTLSNKNVTQIILDTDFASEVAVLSLAKTAKPVPRNENKLRKLCANISQRAIIFDIIIAPRPTTSTKTFSDVSEASGTLNEDTIAGYYKDHVGCVRSVIADSLENWSLDNRYFLNRDLRDNYPYEIWENPQIFTSHYETLGKKDKLWFYDANHLNGIGATIFTKDVVKRLK